MADNESNRATLRVRSRGRSRGGEGGESVPAQAERRPRRNDPRSELLRALIKLAAAALVATIVLAAYASYARRTYALKRLVVDATPFAERGDVASLRRAAQLYRAALDLRRGYGPALAGLAETEALLWVEHGIEAAKPQAQMYAKEAVKLGIESASRFLAEALVAVGEGRINDAERILNDVLARGAASERLFWALGQVELLQGRPKAARFRFKRATDLKSSAPHYARALGDAFEEEDDTRDASQAWELAAKANPLYVQGVARDLFSRIRRLEDRKGAASELQRLSESPADQIGPRGLAAVRFSQSVLHYQSGKLKEALAALDQAAQLEGDSPRTLAQRGWVLLAMGKQADGISALLAAHGRAPGSDRYLYALTDAYVELGRLDDARKTLTAQVTERGQDPRYHVALGDLLVAKKELKEAKAAYDKALALEPFFPRAFLGLGVLAWKQGKFDDARGWFEKAVVAQPKFPEVYEALGLMWIQQGALPQANAQLDMAEQLFRAVDTDPVRMRRFYAAVLSAYARSTAFSKEWSGREKGYREGTLPPLQ